MIDDGAIELRLSAYACMARFDGTESPGLKCRRDRVGSRRSFSYPNADFHRSIRTDCSGKRHRRQPICVSQSDPDQTRKGRPWLARIPAPRRFVRRQSQVPAVNHRLRQAGRPY